MKFKVKGVDLTGNNVTESVDAVHSRLIHRNPEDYGFLKVKSLREVKDNNKRKLGRDNKRSF